jgi:hypothetical protein
MQQASLLKKKLEEREYIIKILANQLAEIKLQQPAKLTRSQKSPILIDSAKHSEVKATTPKATTPLSAKQEMIMKSVNEIYSGGSSASKAKTGWNFL